MLMAMRLMSQRSMSVSLQATRGGHGPVDSWIRNGQGPLGSMPFKVGHQNKAGTAFRVFGLWLALPVTLTFLAITLAQSKA